jgi:hypothetical protein
MVMNAETNLRKDTADEQRGAETLRILLSVAGLLYLFAVVLNSKVNKLGLPEAVVFVTILLFNSKIFASLAELSISSKGIAFKVREVEKSN